MTMTTTNKFPSQLVTEAGVEDRAQAQAVDGAQRGLLQHHLENRNNLLNNHAFIVILQTIELPIIRTLS